MNTSIGDYEIVSELGSGTFATVRRGYHKTTHTEVAIKIIPRTNFCDPDHVARFHREVDLIRDMDHQFIAEFFEVLEDADNFYIIMEYVSNGNLLDYVNNNGELSETQARHYFCQLISVLEYLHVQKKVAHRDLKAENVLLDRNYNIRLIDFGLSNIFTTENPFLQTACGSPAYASVEMLQGKPYTIASDIWSAGVLLYAMVHGELPFSDNNIQRLLQKIVYTEPKYSASISPQLKDLLQRLLMKKPEDRITLQKIKEHPWFSHTEYASMMDKNFGVNEKWRILEEPTSSHLFIDKEIIDNMTRLGIDCKGLVEAYICKQDTHALAIYKMLRKEKITDQMEEISLQRPAASISSYLSTDFPPSSIVRAVPRPASLKTESPLRYSQKITLEGVPLSAATHKNPNAKSNPFKPLIPVPMSPVPQKSPAFISARKNTQPLTASPLKMQMRKRSSSFGEHLPQIMKPL